MSTVSDTQTGHKRLYSSTTEESDTSVLDDSLIVKESSSKPEKKRLNISCVEESSVNMSAHEPTIQELFQKIESRFDLLATKNDLVEMKQDIKTLKDSFTEKMLQLEGRVFEAEFKVEKIQTELATEKRKSDELKNTVRQQDRHIKDNEKAVNDLQQYSRRWNLRVYRVAEADGETDDDCVRKVCQVFSQGVGIATTAADIEVAHRSGKRTGARARPILVRFFDRKKRDTLLANRRKLKNKGTVIDEDLTFANYQLSTRAYKHSATLAAWSNNGRVFAKLKNGLVMRLHIHMDLDEAFRRAINSNSISDVES